MPDGNNNLNIQYPPSRPIKIRSRNKRRILRYLAERSSTVSEVANATGIRVPHASAEIRRLRNDTLLDSDMPSGSRGGRLYLTENGWEALKSDELAMASEAKTISMEERGYCILFRDGPNLLLGLTGLPDSPLLPIPDRPPEKLGGGGFSSGTEGVPWSWAVFTERSPRWVDLSTNEFKSAPPVYDREKIETFSESKSIIGIIRARLLDEERPIAIAPGEWFSTPDHRPKPPLPENSMHRGSWTLANCHEMSPDIRPSSTIVAVVSEKLPRTMLLKAAKSGSLIIADLTGFESNSDRLPLESLDHWISIAHPRLSEAERNRRCQALKDRISGTRRARTEDSTWRRFRQDWGNSEFSSSSNNPRLLDTRGLGKAASESLTRWALSNDENPPLVIDVPDNISKDLANSITSNSNVRMVLIGRNLEPFSGMDSLRIDHLRPLPWMVLSTKEGREVPIRIVDPILHSPDTHQIPLLKEKDSYIANELEALVSSIDDKEYQSMVRSAISQYPEGNEDWANRMEARYPVAAWIASPPRSRWPRWQRLSSRLNPEWLIILDFDHLPLEGLSEIADVAPQPVLDVFSVEFTRLLRTDQNTALKSRPTIDPRNATPGSSWVASQLLANSAWLPESFHDDLIEWSLGVWLAHPPINSINTMHGLMWLLSSNERVSEEKEISILKKILSKASNLPLDHDMRSWAILDRVTPKNIAPSFEEIKLILSNLPLEWWAHISSDLLETMLQDDKAFTWLVSKSISWPAAVLRPVGFESKFPFHRRLNYEGCGSKIRGLLSRRIRGKEDLPSEAEPLFDLLEALDALNENRPPKMGNTHSLVGWLAQPAEKWPEFSVKEISDGDTYVMESLLLKRTGFHQDLISKGTFD